jgi:hypothetical protein
MTDRPIRQSGDLDDARLEAALRDLADAIDWPSATPAGAPDVAMRVRGRLVERPVRRRQFGWSTMPWRRALLLALVALLAVAALAGAVGLGLPGLRLILAGPSASPPPSVAPDRTAPPGPVGSALGLGDPLRLEDVSALTGIAPRLPTDPAIGPPDAVYVDNARNDQLALVWAASEALPTTREPGVGLVLMQFDGAAVNGFHQKLIGPGVTVEPISIAGQDGFWISGPAHFFYYVRDDGTVIEDDRRWVDDALIWSDGTTTYRLESALGRDKAIELAESLE